MNASDSSKEIGGLIRGKYVLLALLITLVVVAVFWIVTNSWVRKSLVINDKALDWSQHTSWSMPPVKHTTVEKVASSYEPKGDQPKWKTIELNPALPSEPARSLLPGEEDLLNKCAELARLPLESFTKDEVGDELQNIADQHPRMFYPRYLLGQWLSLNGNQSQADAAWQVSYADTPAVLMVPYIDSADRALADLTIGTFEVAFDRADGKTLDQTLRLVYPHLTTDATGRVYLPVYASVLRIAEMPQPPGHDVRVESYRWFTFPGRLAALRPVVASAVDAQ